MRAVIVEDFKHLKGPSEEQIIDKLSQKDHITIWDLQQYDSEGVKIPPAILDKIALKISDVASLVYFLDINYPIPEEKIKKIVSTTTTVGEVVKLKEKNINVPDKISQYAKTNAGEWEADNIEKLAKMGVEVTPEDARKFISSVGQLRRSPILASKLTYGEQQNIINSSSLWSLPKHLRAGDIDQDAFNKIVEKSNKKSTQIPSHSIIGIIGNYTGNQELTEFNKALKKIPRSSLLYNEIKDFNPNKFSEPFVHILIGIARRDLDLIKQSLTPNMKTGSKVIRIANKGFRAGARLLLTHSGQSPQIFGKYNKDYALLKTLEKGPMTRKEIGIAIYDEEWGEGSHKKKEANEKKEAKENKYGGSKYYSISTWGASTLERLSGKGKGWYTDNGEGRPAFDRDGKMYVINDHGKQWIKDYEEKYKSKYNYLVSENLNEWKNEKGVKVAAGLVVIQDNKILLVHPTNSPWWGTYSIPKGGIDGKEDALEAARRETKEETGIKIKRKDISNKMAGYIDYTNSKGKVYKRVYYFVARPSKEITKNKFKPQLKEVDWVGFLSKDEAERRIFGRFKPLLKLLK